MMPKTTRSSPKRVKLRFGLHAGQDEIRRSPARFRVVACGRQFGKSRLGCAEGFAVALSGGAVWVCAPDYPLAQIDWRLLKRLARQIPSVQIREAERMISFASGGWLQVKSGHAEGALRGATLDFLVVDEAAFMPRERWEMELRPTLSVKQGRALFLSTFNGENYFSELFERGQANASDYPEWASWRKPTSENPHVDETEIEDARASMSEAEFAQEYLALVSTGVDAIFERGMFERSEAVSDVRRQSVARYAFFDTAFHEKESADYTAYAVFDLGADYRARLVEIGQKRLAYPDLLDYIGDMATRHNADGKLREVVIEQAASGQSAIQSLQASAGWLAPLIGGFKVGSAKKTERAREAAMWCRRGCVLLPPPTEDSAWLVDFERELFRFPSVAHDDRTDAFVMGVLYLRHLLADGLQARGAA